MKFRHDGRWLQHRVPKEYQTRRDAERYAAVFYEEFHQAPRPATEIQAKPPPDDGPTLAEFAERWLALRKTLVEARRIRRSTHKQDKGHWKVHINPVLGSLPIAKLDPPVLRVFIRELAAKKANYTVRNIASTLKQMLDDIDAEGWFAIPRNPMRHSKVVEELPPARTRAGKKVIIHLPKTIAETLLKSPNVDSMQKVRYLTTLTTGLRMGELFGVRIANVALDDNIPLVRIRDALALEGYDGRNTIQPLKTEDSRRDIPLQPLVVSAIRWWIEVGWVRWVGRKPTAGDFLFPNEFGVGYRPKAAADLRRDLARAGCPTTFEGHDVTAHALRRSFSTMLSEVPDAALVKPDLMGHAAPGVDATHYEYRTLERKRRAVSGIVLDVTLSDITNGERSSDDAPPTLTEAAE